MFYHPAILVDLSQPLEDLPPSSVIPLQTARYVAVACLTVSLCLTSRLSTFLVLISYNAVVQLCVWDWLLALSDEFTMIQSVERYRAHLLHIVYYIAR
jgi:hypothetical protein